MPRQIYPWKRTPGTHCIGIWVVPKAGLGTAVKIKKFPCPNRSPILPSSSYWNVWNVEKCVRWRMFMENRCVWIEAQKVRIQKLWVKTMLTAFFYAKCIIHHDCMPGNHTVNSKFYKEAIKILIARVQRVRPEFQESGPWYLLHDNAPVHSSGVVSEVLAKRGIPVLSHPTHSTD
jgi:hypothetical protein